MTRDGFLHSLRARAAAHPKTIVFPEGSEPRVLDAVVEILGDGLATVVLIGPEDDVRAGLRERGVESVARAGCTVVDPNDHARIAATRAHVSKRRAGRGDAPDRLDAMAGDPLMQAGTMVATGEADGVVAGSVRTTADVLRAALVCVGLAPGFETLSSSFYMVFGPEHPRGPSVLTFSDPGVVPEPTARQLAEIAMSASSARTLVVGDAPRVAFLSYSTHGSADGERVRLVREALAHFRDRRPDVPADGELQADAALSEVIAARKAPGSEVAGRANVLVFPDLGAANIGYKLVQHLGGAAAIGPVLQGLARPFNDLSRGAEPGDIVAMTCVTALMAE